MVTAEYLTPDQVGAGNLIYMLAANHAPLMLWNSHLYVVNGLSYAENFDANGGVSYVTEAFSLWDARFSDSRREVSFDRKTEDSGKVQGLLFLQAAKACSIKGNVKNIFLPPPDAQGYFASSSPSRQRRRSSGVVPRVAPSRQMHLLLVATTPIGFGNWQALVVVRRQPWFYLRLVAYCFFGLSERA